MLCNKFHGRSTPGKDHLWDPFYLPCAAATTGNSIRVLSHTNCVACGLSISFYASIFFKPQWILRPFRSWAGHPQPAMTPAWPHHCSQAELKFMKWPYGCLSEIFKLQSFCRKHCFGPCRFSKLTTRCGGFYQWKIVRSRYIWTSSSWNPKGAFFLLLGRSSSQDLDTW